MLRFIWTASSHIAGYLRAYMPSNILLDRIRRRDGLRWGIPAMLIAIPYFALAYWCTTVIDAGGPGWLHLVVLVACWSGLKFLIMGPVSVILLAKARLAEHREQRRQKRRAPDASNTESDLVQPDPQPEQSRCAPTGHEALPHHEHGPAHLGRGSGALRARPQAAGRVGVAHRGRTLRPRTR